MTTIMTAVKVERTTRQLNSGERKYLIMEDNNNHEINGEDRIPREGDVYTVGADKGEVPHPDFREGEYSFKGGDSIPEYRYTYTNQSSEQTNGAGEQSHTKAKKEKKSRRTGGPRKPHTALVVTLVVVAAMLMCMLAGIFGAMIVRVHENADKDPATTTTSEPDQQLNTPDTATDNTSTTTPGDSLQSGSNVVIVKNDDSVTVKTLTGKVGDEALTIPDVVALVKDSVVEIFTEKRAYNGWYVSSGAGSGVIVGKSEDGKIAYVVTNNHVIDSADTINVRLTDGTKYTATLLGADSVTDIAVVAIEIGEDFTVAQLGASAGLVVGESVIAIGNPLGELGGTVTTGIISALAREVTVDNNRMTLLQTNAAVNPGNSGGGLFNMKGELIGIVNAKSTGEEVENIGFAIPVDTAYPIIVELIKYGYVTGRPTAGLTLVDITDRFTAMYYGLDSLGVYVTESKFSQDIKSGDRIVSVNGTKVSSEAEVKSILGEFNVGDKVTFTVARKSGQIDVSVTLREDVPDKNS